MRSESFFDEKTACGGRTINYLYMTDKAIEDSGFLFYPEGVMKLGLELRIFQTLEHVALSIFKVMIP